MSVNEVEPVVREWSPLVMRTMDDICAEHNALFHLHVFTAERVRAYQSARLQQLQEMENMKWVLREIVKRFDTADSGATAIVTEELLAQARGLLA